ncbi:MAG: bifunctional diguanylate cyclase/phosphodiesterase [Magnetovibrionaceae bacterium]
MTDLTQFSWKQSQARALPGTIVAQRRAFLDRAMAEIEMALQPIVNPNSGQIYAYEALLRGHERLGARAIIDLFDQADELGILFKFDLILREKAIAQFARLPHHGLCQLFLNLDARTLAASDYREGVTRDLLDRAGLSPITVCWEISERDSVVGNHAISALLRHYRSKSFRLAIDDFGAGYSGLQLLHEHTPHFIKIDRYFISHLESDKKKKLFVRHVVNLARILGVVVIAEGVETRDELAACRDVGCELVQGFLIDKPSVEIEVLPSEYPNLRELAEKDRRARESDADIVAAEIEPYPAVTDTTPMSLVFEAFRERTDMTFLPVIDVSGQPLGVIQESDLKEYTYSLYGKDLIENKSYGKQLRDFIRPFPVVDRSSPAERMVEVFTAAESAEGLIIVDNLRYAGLLSARSLLRVINEKNIAAARDENPLTQLPGNNSVRDYVARSLLRQRATALVYFDFDNFKPFNDFYGFRQGDRAILLFADLLRKRFGTEGDFIGHIGGDDFFVAMENAKPDEIERRVRDASKGFAHDVESFYSTEDRETGGILARDRDGVERLFPLLTVSAACMLLTEGDKNHSLDAVVEQISALKKQAKTTSGFSMGVL